MACTRQRQRKREHMSGLVGGDGTDDGDDNDDGDDSDGDSDGGGTHENVQTGLQRVGRRSRASARPRVRP